MAEQREPLGLLDIFWRDVERLAAMVRLPTAEPEPAQGQVSNPVTPVDVPVVAAPSVPPEFNGEMTALLERKRREWLAAGVRPGVVRMGLDQAVAGAQGMARRMEFFAREVDKPAVMQDYIENVADAWVRAMSNGVEHNGSG